MDHNHKVKKEYLIRMFNSLSGEDIGLEEYESIRWYEQRGYTYDEARQEVFSEYRAKLLNDNEITQTIVGYKDVELLFSDSSNNKSDDILDDEKLYERYINSISGTFSVICGFSIENNKLIDPNGVVKQIREIYIANEIVQGIKRENEYKSNLSASPKRGYDFSVLEWGAIFYYANSIGAIDNGKSIVPKIRRFISNHSISTTLDHLKNQYYGAKKRINDIGDFPIKKLKIIIPFMKEYYPNAVKIINNDIEILTYELSEKEKFM